MFHSGLQIGDCITITNRSTQEKCYLFLEEIKHYKDGLWRVQLGLTEPNSTFNFEFMPVKNRKKIKVVKCNNATLIKEKDKENDYV